MINFLDNILVQHPSLGVLFSGVGCLIFEAIKRKILKLPSKTITNKTTNKTDNEPAITNITAPTTQSDTQLKSDINQILLSARQDLHQQQEQKFLRYYNKYKAQISSEDAKKLYDKYQEIHLDFMPAYSALLNNLAGLLEAIDQ